MEASKAKKMGLFDIIRNCFRSIAGDEFYVDVKATDGKYASSCERCHLGLKRMHSNVFCSRCDKDDSPGFGCRKCLRYLCERCHQLGMNLELSRGAADLSQVTGFPPELVKITLQYTGFASSPSSLDATTN